MGKATKKIQEKLEIEKSKFQINKKQNHIKITRKTSYQDIMNIIPDKIYNMINDYYNRRINNIDDWRPKYKSIDRISIDLINRMFVKYKYPKFFNKIFLNTDKSIEKTDMRIFLTLCQGGSIYKDYFKYYGISKKETLYFIESPDYINCVSDGVLLAIIKSTRSNSGDCKKYLDIFIKNKNYPNYFFGDKFYIEAFKFFAKQNYDELKYSYQEISDYLFRSNINKNTFSFKNRTLNSLRNLANEWHVQLALQKDAGNHEWPLLFPDMPRIWENNKKPYYGWFCTELNSSKDLIKEGRRMHHCVASYAYSCSHGVSHIFTMFNVNENERYTIEVKNYRIVQCRGIYNKMPNNTAKSVINKWARDHNIKGALI